jgi:transcriptional regulator with XRE-family HTH domain
MSWREVINEVRPDGSIPRRHISEIEHGKRTLDGETARKLALALNCDYRVFM